MSPTESLQLSREFDTGLPSSQGEKVKVISYMIFMRNKHLHSSREAKLFIITYYERAVVGETLKDGM